MKVKPTKKAAKKPAKKRVKKAVEPTAEEVFGVAEPAVDPSAPPPVLTLRASPWQSFTNAARRAWTRFHRLFPRLIWYGQEVDVLITFPTVNKVDHPVEDAVAALRKAGINFDSGFSVTGGRDLYFDWSLSGPVRVKFLSEARNPTVRQELKVQEV